MKKKFVAILLVVLVLATVFAGCDIITKNDERVSKKVLATVSFGEHTDTVTRGDVLSSFNSYGYYYVYYYGYTYEETFKLLTKSLAQRKLLVLYAKYYLNGKSMSFGNDIASVEKLLHPQEVAHAVDATNDSFEESTKSIIEDLEKEAKANQGSTTTDSGNVKVISTADSTEYKVGDVIDINDFQIEITNDKGETETKEITSDMVKEIPSTATTGKKKLVVTYEGKDYSIELTVKSLDARSQRPTEGEADWTYDETLGDGAVTIPLKWTDKDFVSEHKDSEYFEKAVAKLKKNLETNYSDYEKFYEEQLESMLLSHFQRQLLADNFTSEQIAAELSKKAALEVATDRETYEKLASQYATDLGSDVTGIAVHPTEGYGYVYNILLKFSDKQSAELKKYASGGAYFSSEEVYKQVREMLTNEITVNVSNLKYTKELDCDKHTCDNEGCIGDCDKHAECTDVNCPDRAYVATDVPVQTVLSWIRSDLEAAASIENAYERQMATLEVATEWLYRVNDDPGMFATDTYNGVTGKGNGYLITPEGEKSTYVDEFTALGRALVKKGLGSFDTGSTENASDFGFSTTPSENIWYCITDYGIHIMIVSFIPHDFAAFGLDGEKIFATEEEFNAGETPMDYIVKFGTLNMADNYGTFSVDAETGAVSYTGLTKESFYKDGKLLASKVNKSQTYGEKLAETNKSNLTSDLYSRISANVFDENADSIIFDDKKLKKLAKENEK